MSCCEDTEWIRNSVSIQDSGASAMSKDYTYQDFRADAANFAGVAKSAPCEGLLSAIYSYLGAKFQTMAARYGHSGNSANILLRIYAASLAAEDCAGSNGPYEPIVLVNPPLRPINPACPPCPSPCPSLPRSAMTTTAGRADKKNFFETKTFYWILAIISAVVFILLIALVFSRKKKKSFY